MKIMLVDVDAVETEGSGSGLAPALHPVSLHCCVLRRRHRIKSGQLYPDASYSLYRRA